MMKKIFALVLMLVLGKISYSQYPISQNLGSDSTIVISKGALQSRLINVTYTDTFAANNQRIGQYPGAQIATTTGGLNLWVRNATATGWLPVATGSGNNIYTINGTLLGNRTLAGGGYPLTFTGLDKFVVSADSIRFTTGDLKFGLNTDSASLTKKISYSGNYRGDYKQFTLVDKGYVDSVVASSPAGTVTSIATNNGSGITGGTITSTGTLAIDTTNVISTKANVTSSLAGKLNISDTAAMLAPYLRKVDTASLSNRINQKLNISDTATMLGNYVNNVGYGLAKSGQVVSADSAILSNYYLRRKDSLTATNLLGYVTRKVLADTAAAIRASDVGGSVTSVATNNGTGITGGTITTTGTLAIDTLLISTRAWRQKGVDSLQANINLKLNISDTASMLNPYLRKVDTASLSNRINQKLNISDTASMLSPYLRSNTAAATYVPQTRTLTINGTTQDLSANRTYNVGTVTSVGLTMPAAFNVAGSPVTSSGTLAVTGAGLASQYIRGDGTLADFPGGGGGGGASISYYLNGSVNQGTFGGNTYYEMNKVPILGAGTNFSINANGYIAQFITDAGDPGLLNIPAGNWNFETFFSASSGGGTPTYYVELYKYDGTTFTLIASGSTNPDAITGGTSVEAYFSTLPVPQTTLTLTDRLAVRIYVTHSGRTITLHTEDNNLCQIITTFTTGITAINSLTAQVQYLTTGTSGTDFNISSSVATHTFNLPTASATNRGALSTTDWTTFNNKVGGSLISGYIPKATGTNTIDTSQLFQNGQNVGIGTLTPNGRLAIVDTGGFALKINYNSASNLSDSNAAIYAENNGLSSYVAIFNEKTTNNTGAQLPLLIESSLTTGIPQANMGTGMDFGTRDDANNRKLNRFIIRGTDPAAATYTSRAEFRLWNNGVQTTPYYWLGNGNMGLGTSTPDSNLTVVNGAYFQRGIRASGLPAAPGTKALRIDASGTLSYADTLIDAGGTVTSVATNNGTGITGGTITTSGTLAIDTLLISTRAWRQKGVDSVISVMGSRVNGTTNYVSKFTGTNTIGNSQIFDNATSVGIGTAFPSASYKLDVNGNINVSNAVNYSQGGTKYGWTYATSGAMAMEGLQGADISLGTGSGAVATERMVIKNSGIVGIGIAPDSMFTVAQGTHLQRGVRMSGLPSAVGTKSLRIDASGTVSVADTGSFVPTSRTLTINGTTHDLSADRTWNVGTVTTAAATGGGHVAFFNGSTLLTSISTLYFDGVNKLAIGNSSPDSMLSVTQGAHIQRGVRLSGLPTAPGTRALRINANGTLSVSDTLANGISGSGTTNYLPKFTGTSTIGNSIVQDNGSAITIAGNVGINGSPGNSFPLEAYINSSTAYTTSSRGNVMRVYNSNTSANIFAGIELGGAGTANDGLAGINAVVTGSGSAALTFYTRNSNTFSEKLRLDASGNLGLGVTPSAWNIGSPVIQMGTGVHFFGAGIQAQMGSNNYYNGSAYIYSSSNFASRYLQNNGQHIWDIAPSGTAGNAISFTQAMTLDASGNLGIGTTVPGVRLHAEATNSNVAIINVIGTAPNYIFDVRDDGVSKFRVDPSGNVGIGTTSPGRQLEVYSATTDTRIAITNTTSTSGAAKGLELLLAGSDGYAFNYANGALIFGTNATERMRITSGGNVGIGTQIPDTYSYGGNRSFLTLAATATNQEPFLQLIANGTGNSLIDFGNATIRRASIIGFDGSHLGFYTNGSNSGTSVSERMRITSGGNVGIGNTNPNALLTLKNSATNTRLELDTESAGSSILSYDRTASAYKILYLRGSDIQINPNDVTAMTIKAGGNVGIGTTNPAALFDVTVNNAKTVTAGVYAYLGKTNEASNYAALQLLQTGAAAAANRTWSFQTIEQGVANAGNISFQPNGGNVGIGTTSPTQTFDVRGTGVFGNGTSSYYVDASADATNAFVRASGTTDGMFVGTRNATAFRIFTNDSEKMRITSGGEVGINTQTPNATLHTNGSIASAISIKTATYTLTSSDYTVVFDLNGNATANLPNATTCSGRIYVIKINRTSVSDVLTIDPNGAQTIDGNATYDLQCQQAITIQSDGSNWRIIGDYWGGLNCL